MQAGNEEEKCVGERCGDGKAVEVNMHDVLKVGKLRAGERHWLGGWSAFVVGVVLVVLVGTWTRVGLGGYTGILKGGLGRRGRRSVRFWSKKRVNVLIWDGYRFHG